MEKGILRVAFVGQSAERQFCFFSLPCALHRIHSFFFGILFKQLIVLGKRETLLIISLEVSLVCARRLCMDTM